METIKTPLVILQYSDLDSFDVVNLRPEDTRLLQQIEEAFGPTGLGILAVEGVPDFAAHREALLPLGRKLPSLPDLQDCVHEASKFSTGWSHGREQLAAGQPDVAKGSYYANPFTDDLVASLSDRDGRREYWETQAELYPEFYCPNVWPQSLPQLRTAFSNMGLCLAKVGRKIATVCDVYCRQNGVVTHFEDIITNSLNSKGRLLHYFDQSGGGNHEGDDLWCGWHNDHGSLTGLVPAMYFSGTEQVQCPDEKTGLYIQSRSGGMVHVQLPVNACGFQIGETCQIQSGGLLRATPHAVKAPRGVPGISRVSFALFLEPEFEYPLEHPQAHETSLGLDDEQAEETIHAVVPLNQRYKPGQTFGQFHVATVTAFTPA